MTSTTQHISQPRQAKFDTDGVYNGIDNRLSGTMYHIKQEFVGPIMKGHLIINRFEGPKLHMIYKVNIARTIDYNKAILIRFKYPTLYM